MLEIHAAEAVIVACHASPEALDALPADLGSVIRVAPDEAWVVGPRGRRADVLASVARWLAGADPAGLVVDQTDGWAIWAVRGPRADELFGRLSVSPLPASRPALVQGALAGVPGKVVLTESGTWYLVPSPAGHHLRDRIRETAAELGATFRDPEPLDVDLGRLPVAGVPDGAEVGP